MKCKKISEIDKGNNSKVNQKLGELLEQFVDKLKNVLGKNE